MRTAATVRGLHLAAFAIFAGLLITAVLAAAAPHLPSWIENVVGFLGYCPYRARTGTPCPLCGGLTAFAALLHGNIADARAANRAALLLAPVILLQISYRALRIRKPKLSLVEETVVVAAGLLPGALLAL